MEVHQKNITLEGNMREAIVNPGPTRPPFSKPALTTDVRNFWFGYRNAETKTLMLWAH